MIVGIIRRKPVLTYASIIFGDMLASVNSVSFLLVRPHKVSYKVSPKVKLKLSHVLIMLPSFSPKYSFCSQIHSIKYSVTQLSFISKNPHSQKKSANRVESSQRNSAVRNGKILNSTQLNRELRTQVSDTSSNYVISLNSPNSPNSPTPACLHRRYWHE